MAGDKRIPYSFIDEYDVMMRLNENVDLFNRLFTKFIISYKFSNIDLAQLIDEKKYADARLLVHKIKGTSANLGIVELCDAADDLEKSIVNQDNAKIQSGLLAFSAVIDKIVKEVNQQ